MKLLATSLGEQGAEVQFLPRGRLSLVRSAFGRPRPHIVHLQWQHGFLLGPTWPTTLLHTAAFFLQVLVLKVCGVSIVWTVHNIVNHETRFLKWELSASRLLARLVDAIVVHCRGAVDEVTASYGINSDRLHVVHHAHYGEAYPTPVGRVDARRQLDLPEDGKIVLFFGQIRPYKGIEKLLAAFSGVDEREARLVIVGAPKPQSLGEAISAAAGAMPNVSLRLEFIDSDTLSKYICSSDVVVLPYLKSLTSGSGILAATFGRPLVAPRLGCLGDFPDTAAILYDEGSPFDLEQAIAAALRAPLDQMGAAAMEFVMQYSWTRTAREVLNVYSRILRRD